MIGSKDEEEDMVEDEESEKETTWKLKGFPPPKDIKGLLLLEIWGDQDFVEETMNSMFSSFDALCAELLGQKVRSSLALTTMDCNTKRVLTAGDDSKVAEDKLIKNREGSSSRSLGRKQEKKVPRFAPELDGLNCFETIVNY
ncbi:hypothetical protein POTOM_006886 [Populus tomentosa]|uniref:Uncharacterized protein n=1 Tax=Populus tomentosa TaxID=118781 RepID=A0A8X8APP6_POPTO|nr:hypothetical protein POTOM_006886 [Populus tomentosa]